MISRMSILGLALILTLSLTASAFGQDKFPAANAHGYLDIFQMLETSSLHELNTEDLKKIDECMKKRAFLKLRIPKGTVLEEDFVIPSCFEKDPYARYETSTERVISQEEHAGKFYGIGVEITATKEKTGVRVEKVFPNGPAGRDGRLQKNDIITAVGDNEQNLVDLKETPVYDASKLIRGKKGTRVTLQILRGGQTLTIALTRGEVKIESTESRLLEPEIGYLKITRFTEENLLKDEVSPALKKFYFGKVKAVVIDLRGDPGGLLYPSLQFLELFSPKKDTLMIEVRGRKQQNASNGTGDNESEVTQYRTSIKGMLARWKVVVLVDKNSASASEIVAGVLQRWDAEVFGTQTFGKGSVQTVIPVSDGGALYLTTARYHFADGETPEGKGITPNKVLKIEEITSPETGEVTIIDHPLEEAKKYLQKVLKEESEKTK